MWQDLSPSEESAYTQKFKVSLVASEHCSCQTQACTVSYGESPEFYLQFEDGFTFANCSYRNSKYVSKGKGQGILTLNRITGPTRFRVNSKERASGIHYHLNGGAMEDGGDSFTEEVSLINHLRANTAINLGRYSREGYVQIGWNSLEDGDGEHYGMGSRITVAKGADIDLYAEWVKAMPETYFDVKERRNGMTITKFHGFYKGEWFAIPETIGGKAVVAIAPDAFHDVVADNLVLPSKLRSIELGSFTDCSFQNLYAYDNVTRISDADFLPMGIETFHLNAAKRPNFIGFSENTCFADNIDRMMMTYEEDRILFYGGCSMGYGLDCALVQQAAGESRHPLNLGFLGGANAAFQVKIISEFIHSGDIFVHAPEQMSEFQFFRNVDAEARIFECCEGNYDLLTYLRPADYKDFYYSWGLYGAEKEAAKTVYDYEDSVHHQNEYGDFTFERVNLKGDVGFSDGTYTYDLGLTDQETVNGLCAIYQKLEALGCLVLFSYAPMNITNLKKEQRENEIWRQFAERLEVSLGVNGYIPISRVDDYLFPGRYFYDTDYHLTNEGAELRTRQLLYDLRGIL